jgi:hypothetical protein
MKREDAQAFLREFNALTKRYGVRISRAVAEGGMLQIDEFRHGQCLMDVMADKDKQDEPSWLLSAPWPG